MTKPIKAIIFDLEGVVVDSEPLWSEANVVLLWRHGLTGYDDARTKHLLMGRSVVEAVRILQAQYNIPGDPYELAAERKQIFLELVAKELKFIPGFQTFFEPLREHYHVAAATSAERRFLQAFSNHLDLQKLFGKHIYSIEDINFVSKPNPDIFQHAAKGINVNPEACVVVEDAPNGVQAAKAAGMRCIALTTSTTQERLAAAGADAVVDDYSEIDLTKPNFVSPASFKP